MEKDDPIRITQVMLSAGYGGGERMFVDLCLALADRGHSIQAVCHPVFQGLSQLDHEHMEISNLKVTNDWSPLARYRFRKRLLDFEPAVINSHMARAVAVAGSVGRNLDIPPIANMHNQVNLKYYKNIDHFIAGTDNQELYLEENGISTEHIITIPHFGRLPEVDESKLPESCPPIFASFGRFVHKKGSHVLLNSICILRDECLNESVFSSLNHARRIVEAWREHYNKHRPHSGIGYLTPVEYWQQLEQGA